MATMSSSHVSSSTQQLRKLLGITTLTGLGIAGSVYAINRWRKTRQSKALTATLPAVPPKPVPDASDNQPAQTDDMTDELATEDLHEATTPRALEELTVEELYRLARRYDVEGRSNMRKAELIEALQAEGITTAEV